MPHPFSPKISLSILSQYNLFRLYLPLSCSRNSCRISAKIYDVITLRHLWRYRIFLYDVTDALFSFTVAFIVFYSGRAASQPINNLRLLSGFVNMLLTVPLRLPDVHYLGGAAVFMFSPIR